MSPYPRVSRGANLNGCRTIALVVLTLAACGNAGPGAGANSPVSTASATATTTASTAPTASNSAGTPYPACVPAAGGTAARATITDLRAETAPGHDRLIVEFDRVVPSFALRVNHAGTHFTGTASGAPIILAGSAGLLLHLDHLDLPNRYPHGTDLATGYPVVEEVRVVGDFEGTADVAIGLTRGVCPVLTTAAGPPRLVVDFPSG